jgi:hypothetical protein
LWLQALNDLALPSHLYTSYIYRAGE